MSSRRRLVIALAALFFVEGAALADDSDRAPSPTPVPGALEPAPEALEPAPEALEIERQALLADQDTMDREQFLEERLKAGVRNSSLWQIASASGYGLGFLTQTTRAIVETNAAARVDLILSSTKAAIGVVSRLARPPDAMYGTRELNGLPWGTPAERRARLARAEAMLRRNAKQCDQRYSWVAHTVNIALNLAAGLVVWLGYHDLTQAATSAGIGFAVGELQIWSQPWQPKRDWAEYRRRFGSVAFHSSEPRKSIVLVPAIGRDQQGAALRFNF